MSTTHLIQRISNLQYHCMLVASGLIIYSILTDIQTNFYYCNQALVLMGLGISFSTLKDTTTTQNEISKRVWEDPVKGRRFIIISAIATFTFIIVEIIGFFSPFESIIRQVSIGLIALGISLIGMLETMVEMFENQRLDKNPLTSE